MEGWEKVKFGTDSPFKSTKNNPFSWMGEAISSVSQTFKMTAFCW